MSRLGAIARIQKERAFVSHVLYRFVYAVHSNESRKQIPNPSDNEQGPLCSHPHTNPCNYGGRLFGNNNGRARLRPFQNGTGGLIPNPRGTSGGEVRDRNFPSAEGETGRI